MKRVWDVFLEGLGLIALLALAVGYVVLLGHMVK